MPLFIKIHQWGFHAELRMNKQRSRVVIPVSLFNLKRLTSSHGFPLSLTSTSSTVYCTRVEAVELTHLCWHSWWQFFYGEELNIFTQTMTKTNTQFWLDRCVHKARNHESVPSRAGITVVSCFLYVKVLKVVHLLAETQGLHIQQQTVVFISGHCAQGKMVKQHLPCKCWYW